MTSLPPGHPLPKRRVDWIDAARGLGIVLVVFGHVERGLVPSGMVHGLAWAWADYGLYTFHMPMFFLLSGVNLPASLAKGRAAFLRDKLWTVAYPYVLWSIIQGATLVTLSSYTNHALAAASLLKIGWRPISPFWFLYALMVCQMLGFALAGRPRLLVVSAVASMLASTALPQGGLVEEILHAVPFFALGIVASGRILVWRPNRDWLWLCVAAAGLAISIPFSGLRDGMDFDALAALPAAGCGILLVMAIARVLRGMALRWACLLGRASMTIYVLHIMAASGSRIVLLKLHVPPSAWLYVSICTAIGAVAPLCVHRALSRRELLAPLGLAPLRRKQAITIVR